MDIFDLNLSLQNLFDNNKSNDFYNPINIYLIFSKELEYGIIEYKRTLISYYNKTDKLLRQILWRINQDSDFNLNTNSCFYIIGIEDSGADSKLSTEELNLSLLILKNTIINTNISLHYLYLLNKNSNSLIIVAKLSMKNYNNLFI